jgi:tetratricopeptide (TPR) repeat protein
MTIRNEPLPKAGGRRSAAARVLLAMVFAGCAAAPAPAPEGVADDFDAPRPKVVASLLGAAANREARGDVEGALHLAERAHAAAPQSGAAVLREAELRAWAAIRAGDDTGLAEARAAVKAVVDEHPEAPIPRLAHARLELAAGDPKQAIAEATALIADRPDWAAPQALLSRAVLADDPRRALQLADRAVALAPSDPVALGARARALAASGRYGEASTDARRALLSRSDPELVEIVAGKRLRSGDPRGAAREIESTLEAERTVRLELLLAQAKTLLGDGEAAEGAIVRAKTRAGDDPKLQVQAIDASVHFAIGRERAAEALAEVQAARALGPDDAELAELEAIAKIALGRNAEAEIDARRSIELDPQRISAWHTMAGVLERQGVKPPAFERARAAVGGSDARGHALAARLAEQSGDVDAARTQYETALALDPDLAIAQLGVAELSWKLNAPRALALAERAQAAMGWNIATAKALGVALHANERSAEAVEVLRVGIGSSDPGSNAAMPLQVALAFALDDAGEKDEARRLASALIETGTRMDPAPVWLTAVSQLREKIVAESGGKEAAGAAKPPAAKPPSGEAKKEPAAGAPKPQPPAGAPSPPAAGEAKKPAKPEPPPVQLEVNTPLPPR